MPCKTQTVEAELFVFHRAIKVFRTYLDDDYDNPEQFIFTTHKSDTDSTSPYAFDIRTIGDVTKGRPELVDDTWARKRGLDMVEFIRTPEYIALKVAWDDWYENKLPELIRQLVIDAIDKGIIT